MQIATIAARTSTPPTSEFPVEAVDRARGLLADARITVKGMRETQDLSYLGGARRDVLAAVKLLSTATNVSIPFSQKMSHATSHALDAANWLGKAIDSLKFVDSGMGQEFAYDALDNANKSLDRAWKDAMTGTHP